eukprot:m.219206 g.219206  ORF g.219206 m.219206 type:complete len:124 (+) comp15576_c0_seq1:78-449(+)
MLQTACRRGFAVASVKCFPIPQWRRGCSSRNHDRDRAGAYENSDPELDIPASEIVLASKPAPGSPVTLDNFAHQSYNLQNDAVQGYVSLKDRRQIYCSVMTPTTRAQTSAARARPGQNYVALC